jgi:hypothetical protein
LGNISWSLSGKGLCNANAKKKKTDYNMGIQTKQHSTPMQKKKQITT